jgi:hypothetical protein
MAPKREKSGLFHEAQQAEQRGNREGRDLWDRYATHRREVTAAALALAPPSGGRIVFLGAGNANDLDLAQLAARYAEVHLVDIDPSALARAVGRQDAATRAKLKTHAPVDLSGLYRQLDGAGRKRPRTEALVPAGVAEIARHLPSDFDVVVSGCMLSQMSWALTHHSGEEPATLPELEQALATIHLRTLVGLAKVGGVGLLVADLVSNAAYPVDELPADTDLHALVQKLAESRTAFTVCNPGFLRQLLRRDPELAARAAPPEMGGAWIWTGSQDRTFLVYTMLLRRRG